MDDRAKKITNDLNELHEAYKETFSSKFGQKVLEDLKKVCSYYSSTVGEPAVVDPYKVVRNEGRREVVLRIEQYIDANKVSNELNKLRGIK